MFQSKATKFYNKNSTTQKAKELSRAGSKSAVLVKKGRIQAPTRHKSNGKNK